MGWAMKQGTWFFALRPTNTPEQQRAVDRDVLLDPQARLADARTSQVAGVSRRASMLRNGQPTLRVLLSGTAPDDLPRRSGDEPTLSMVHPIGEGRRLAYSGGR